MCFSLPGEASPAREPVRDGTGTERDEGKNKRKTNAKGGGKREKKNETGESKDKKTERHEYSKSLPKKNKERRN